MKCRSLDEDSVIFRKSRKDFHRTQSTECRQEYGSSHELPLSAGHELHEVIPPTGFRNKVDHHSQTRIQFLDRNLLHENHDYQISNMQEQQQFDRCHENQTKTSRLSMNSLQNYREAATSTKCRHASADSSESERNLLPHSSDVGYNSKHSSKSHLHNHSVQVVRNYDEPPQFDNRFTRMKLNREAFTKVQNSFIEFFNLNSNLILRDVWEKEIVGKTIEKLSPSHHVNTKVCSVLGSKTLSSGCNDIVCIGEFKETRQDPKIIVKCENVFSLPSDSSTDDGHTHSPNRRQDEALFSKIRGTSPNSRLNSSYEKDSSTLVEVSQVFSGEEYFPPQGDDIRTTELNEEQRSTHSQYSVSYHQDAVEVEVTRTTYDPNMKHRCKTYMKKKFCPKGSSCKYIHSWPKDDDILCREYEKGYCSNAEDKCWYKHEKTKGKGSTINETICSNQVTECNNSDVTESHDKKFQQHQDMLQVENVNKKVSYIDPFAKQRCRSYKKRKSCPKGSDCLYRHSWPKDDNIFCMQYEKGLCEKSEEECWYKHSQSTRDRENSNGKTTTAFKGSNDITTSDSTSTNLYSCSTDKSSDRNNVEVKNLESSCINMKCKDIDKKGRENFLGDVEVNDTQNQRADSPKTSPEQNLSLNDLGRNGVDEFSKVRCKAFLSDGSCPEGKLCKFIHRLPKDDNVLCSLFLNANCMKNDFECVYKHQKKGTVQKIDVPTNNLSLILKTICKKYLRSRSCPKGRSCAYSHTLPKDSDILCENFKAGCCNRSKEDCWFKHSDETDSISKEGNTVEIMAYENKGFNGDCSIHASSLGNMINLLKSKQKKDASNAKHEQSFNSAIVKPSVENSKNSVNMMPVKKSSQSSTFPRKEMSTIALGTEFSAKNLVYDKKMTSIKYVEKCDQPHLRMEEDSAADQPQRNSARSSAFESVSEDASNSQKAKLDILELERSKPFQSILEIKKSLQDSKENSSCAANSSVLTRNCDDNSNDIQKDGPSEQKLEKDLKHGKQTKQRNESKKKILLASKGSRSRKSKSEISKVITCLPDDDKSCANLLLKRNYQDQNRVTTKKRETAAVAIGSKKASKRSTSDEIAVSLANSIRNQKENSLKEKSKQKFLRKKFLKVSSEDKGKKVKNKSCGMIHKKQFRENVDNNCKNKKHSSKEVGNEGCRKPKGKKLVRIIDQNHKKIEKEAPEKGENKRCEFSSEKVVIGKKRLPKIKLRKKPTSIGVKTSKTKSWRIIDSSDESDDADDMPYRDTHTCKLDYVKESEDEESNASDIECDNGKIHESEDKENKKQKFKKIAVFVNEDRQNSSSFAKCKTLDQSPIDERPTRMQLYVEKYAHQDNTTDNLYTDDERKKKRKAQKMKSIEKMSESEKPQQFQGMELSKPYVADTNPCSRGTERVNVHHNIVYPYASTSAFIAPSDLLSKESGSQKRKRDTMHTKSVISTKNAESKKKRKVHLKDDALHRKSGKNELEIGEDLCDVNNIFRDDGYGFPVQSLTSREELLEIMARASDYRGDFLREENFSELCETFINVYRVFTDWEPLESSKSNKDIVLEANLRILITVINQNIDEGRKVRDALLKHWRSEPNLRIYKNKSSSSNNEALQY